MAPNSLSPASAVLSYSTLFGSHRMTIPTTEWFPTSITGDLGSYLDWDGNPVDAEVMWTTFVTLLKPFVPTTTTFDNVTVYTQASAMSPNIPRKTVSLAIVGTSALTGLSQAQSSTFNFKTVDNGDFKLVLLDVPLGSQGFNAIHPADFGAEVLALQTYVVGNTNAISGRDDAQVQVLRKITYDLNRKLQRVYKMSA